MALSAAQQIWAGLRLAPVHRADDEGVCSFCGGPMIAPWSRKRGLIKATFTDHDRLRPGPVQACAACVWFLDEGNRDLQRMTGKEKPQRPRNYSWGVRDGITTVWSKAHKRLMAEALTADTLPEVLVIAESGQKHLFFKAKFNPPGQRAVVGRPLCA